MNTRTVTLTGWKAVVAILVVVGLTAFRVTTARSTLDTQGREALEMWIKADVMRPILADSTLGLAQQGEALLAAHDVRIRSLQARGPLDDAVVKVELEPNAAFGPDTPLVRYNRMRYSSVLGWTHQGDASVVSWYLAAF